MANGGQGWDTLSPVGRGAVLMTHDLRRWALEYALRHGSVTTRDVERQFPAASPNRVAVLVRGMVTSGVLVCLAPQTPGSYANGGGPALYGPGNVSDLRALHAALTELLALSPTPEVPRETDR